MEHAQRDGLETSRTSQKHTVLILILMEHAQRVMIKVKDLNGLTEVLILILMEHAQRVCAPTQQLKFTLSCLNPYFNGTCSKRRNTKILWCTTLSVLILILMEHAQRDIVQRSAKQS